MSGESASWRKKLDVHGYFPNQYYETLPLLLLLR